MNLRRKSSKEQKGICFLRLGSGGSINWGKQKSLSQMPYKRILLIII